MKTKDKIYSLLFNEYRKNIINTSFINMNLEEYLDFLSDPSLFKDKDFMSYCILRKYLKDTQEVSTYNEILDIINIKNKELKKKYDNLLSEGVLDKLLNNEIKEKILKEDEEYSYFDSKNIFGEHKKIEETDYRIIIKTEDKEKILLELLETFNSYNIPFLFKVSKEENSIILDVDNKNLNVYRIIIDNMPVEKPMTYYLEEKKKEKMKPLQFIKKRLMK